jgi:hypothetical protein
MIKSLTAERASCRREREARDKQPTPSLGSIGEDGVGCLDPEELAYDGDDSGGGGDDEHAPLRQSPESSDEFRGYSILYAYVRNSWMDLKAELARSGLRPPPLQVAAAPVLVRSTCPRLPPAGATLHALSVVKAMDDHDYRTFFRLYSTAPHMSAYLMDFLVKRTLVRAAPFALELSR